MSTNKREESEGLVPTHEVAKNWWYNELTVHEQRSLKEKHNTFDIYTLYLKEHTVKEESDTKEDLDNLEDDICGRYPEEKDTPVEETVTIQTRLDEINASDHSEPFKAGMTQGLVEGSAIQVNEDRELIKELLDGLVNMTGHYISSVPSISRQKWQQEYIDNANALCHKANSLLIKLTDRY